MLAWSLVPRVRVSFRPIFFLGVKSTTSKHELGLPQPSPSHPASILAAIYMESCLFSTRWFKNIQSPIQELLPRLLAECRSRAALQKSVAFVSSRESVCMCVWGGVSWSPLLFKIE